jgi:hypothetical protein
MGRDGMKQVAYLDLEDIEVKERFFYFLSWKSDRDVLSLEDRFENWVDLIDR